MACNETCVNGLIPRFDPGVAPMGCYNLKAGYDKTNDTFNGLESLNSPTSTLTFSNPYKNEFLMDPGYCIKYCIDYLFDFAALSKGISCYCGKENALDAYELVDDKLCNYTCNFPITSGNVTYKCGGDVAYTVYKAETPKYQPPGINIKKKLDIISNLGKDPRYKYFGCVLDNQICGQRVLNGSCDSNLNDMSVDKCLDFCKDYKYAGLQSSNQCFCGETFDKLGRNVGPTDCSSSCVGNLTQICGGSWVLSIYNVTPSSTTSTTFSQTTTKSLPSTVDPIKPSEAISTVPFAPNILFLLVIYIFILNCFKH
jgi:hypothetical protein